jgi:hypothetical protein
MAEIKSEPKRGRSNYWIELVGMDSLHRSGAANVHFKISARDGTKELFSTTIPMTVHGGGANLDATAARACEYMGDALHKMLGIVDDLRNHYSRVAPSECVDWLAIWAG